MLLYSELMQIPYVRGLRRSRLVQQIVWLCDMGNHYIPLLPLPLEFKVENSIHFKGVQKKLGFILRDEGKATNSWFCGTELARLSKF
jgi:hypothetical protein